MAKRDREYNGYTFSDNGHGDLYNEELDRFLIYRPYPLLVQTIQHKDENVTLNREQFQKNVKENKGVFEEGYEENDDGTVFVKKEDVSKKVKEKVNEESKKSSEKLNQEESEAYKKDNLYDESDKEEFIKNFKEKYKNDRFLDPNELTKLAEKEYYGNKFGASKTREEQLYYEDKLDQINEWGKYSKSYGEYENTEKEYQKTWDEYNKEKNTLSYNEKEYYDKKFQELTENLQEYLPEEDKASYEKSLREVDNFIEDFPNDLYKIEDIEKLANKINMDVDKTRELIENRRSELDRNNSNWKDWLNELYDQDKIPSEIAKDWNKITGQIADELDYNNEDLPNIADRYLMRNGITEENGYDEDYISRLRNAIIESMNISEYSVNEIKDLGITNEDLESAEEYSKTVDRQPWKNEEDEYYDNPPREYLEENFESSDLYNAIDNGILNQEEVNEMALKYVSYDDIIDAMRMLDYDTDKYNDINSIYNDGNLDDSDLDRIGYEILQGMSSDDLKDMLRYNEIELEDLF